MLNRRFSSLILILLLAFTTSSCINILNEIKINSDKSGTSFIGIEFSALSTFLDMGSDELDPDIKSNVINFPNVAKEKLKNIDGISNIRTLGVLSNGRIGIEFDFKNMRALNKVYYSLSNHEKKWYYPNLIKIKNHKVKLKDISSQIKSVVEDNNDNPEYNKFLKYLNFRTQIIVPTTITSEKIGQGTIKRNGKTFINNASLTSIMNNNANTGVVFKY